MKRNIILLLLVISFHGRTQTVIKHGAVIKQMVNVTETRPPSTAQKTNYFFAAQAVDADSHESLAVFPKAGR